MKPRITTHLWFDKEAREAAGLYTSLFKGSKVKNTTTLEGTPSGSVDIVTVDLAGQEFTLLSAGPLFRFRDPLNGDAHGPEGETSVQSRIGLRASDSAVRKCLRARPGCARRS